MNRQRLGQYLFTTVLIFTLVMGAVMPASAQGAADFFSNFFSVQDENGDQPLTAEDLKDQIREKKDRIRQKERKLAAARAFQKGRLNPLMLDVRTIPARLQTEQNMQAAQAAAPAAQAALAAAPGDAPRYFSHPNYANSPLPDVQGSESAFGNPLIDRQFATDSAPDVFVVLAGSPLPDGFITGFQVLNQAAAASGPLSAGQKFHAYVLRPTVVPNLYTVVFDSGLLTMPALADPAVSEIVTFATANLAVKQGDLLAFYGQGVPHDVNTGADFVSNPPVRALPLMDTVLELGGGVYPDNSGPRTYSFSAQVIPDASYSVSGGIRKFVDTLPGLGAGAANNLGQFIPVAVPDTTTYPGSDFYIIELGEYSEQLHSDLPPTTLRGYRQAGGQFHYLGPAIVATKDRPVRILFRNLLPTGAGGNLFLPVDSTVMGSGPTPEGHMMKMMDMPMPPWDDPLKPPCSEIGKEMMVAMGECYADNRATLHLHGGVTPWISDGTPHQWITPAGENTAYPEGVSVVDVPDMPTPAPGEMTFFYSNQQSARLMFYHDHAWGITRLNVYAGEAAPYIITDATEQALVNNGTLPGAADTIPLVIQDKTFVPDTAQLAMQDESWDTSRWGGLGNLWVPHVYSPAQNPGDSSGINEYGRWAYGPWFWPPTTSVDHGPVANPYYDDDCDPDSDWCEPEEMPGVPYLSMGMESFNDTPVVNGTAYPTITLDPKPYRFRVLNAANDRFFNLSLYQAIDADGNLCDAANLTPVPERTGVACTEVALNPAEVAAALEDSTIFPTPLSGTEGPDWIQFGTEGGFLPAPVVIPAHVTTWVNDPTVFNAGNVDQHSLLLAPAERADVVVDFSQFAGQTLILYNDAPAAFPARDPRYDYYTGSGDYRDTGGAPSTLPGYGPNTRTVMQIKVNAGPAYSFNLGALQNAFSHKPDGSGVFESGQHPIIVGQGAYNSAYGTTFQKNGRNAGLVQIYDTSFSFKTLANGATGPSLTFPLQPKQIQDEMGEAFEREYGRMSGFLGVETPNAQAGLQNMILHPYSFPPTEVINGIEGMLGPGMEVTPIATADDGTQIWKITHNGVDTHPIHFHLYDVQLINRVGWDGIIRKPEANELGWKDTIRISPLEDTIVALRPLIPQMPTAWGSLPNSIRLLDPTMHEGMYLANTTQQEALGLPVFAFDPNGEPIDVINHTINFGWEYVYHCHILSHEEMDMMHAQAVGVTPPAPANLSAVLQGSSITLTWDDTSHNETSFVIQRASDAGFTTALVTFEVPAPGLNGAGVGQQTFIDDTNPGTQVFYRVLARNVVGDTWDYTDPALNEGASFPTLTKDSAFSNTATLGAQPPAAPSGLTAVAQAGPQALLTWIDNAGSETGFEVERCTGAGCTSFAQIGVTAADVAAFTDTGVVAGATYSYRVRAVGAGGPSSYSNVATLTIPSQGTQAPTNVVVTAARLTNRNDLVTLTWVYPTGTNITGFTIQRATNPAFTAGLATSTVGANIREISQVISRNVTLYYRIRANGPDGSSPWVNAAPFPIVTP